MQPTTNDSRLSKWFRVGRRFEYTIVALGLVWFLWMYLTLLRDVPPTTMVGVIVWLSAGLPTAVLAILAFEFGPSRRRFSERKASDRSQARKLASRLLVYFLLSVVVIFAAIRVGGTLLEKKIVAATSILYFLASDLAILMLVIAWNELQIWRKARHSERE